MTEGRNAGRPSLDKVIRGPLLVYHSRPLLLVFIVVCGNEVTKFYPLNPRVHTRMGYKGTTSLSLHDGFFFFVLMTSNSYHHKKPFNAHRSPLTKL